MSHSSSSIVEEIINGVEMAAWQEDSWLQDNIMRNTYCLNQVKFSTEYSNVQHVIITQI